MMGATKSRMWSEASTEIKELVPGIHKLLTAVVGRPKPTERIRPAKPFVLARSRKPRRNSKFNKSKF